MTDQALKIVYRDPAKLKPFAKNAREHSEAQVRQIRASMEQYGWTNPVLLRDDGATIGAGHGRALAALLDPPIGKVPTIIVPGLSDAQWRAYTLADNRLPLDATWNMDLLKAELSDLQSIGFDLSFTGFDGLELRGLLGGVGAGKDPEEVPPAPAVPVSRLGDLWVLGDHRLICGDSTSATDVARLMAGDTGKLMVTDPPYGVSYDANWRNEPEKLNSKSPTTFRKLNAAKGVVLNDDREDWSEAYRLFAGNVAYVWHGERQGPGMVAQFDALGFAPRNLIIWAKDGLVISRGHYHPQHEGCWYLVRKGCTANRTGDRKQSTLWEITRNRSNETGHSTQKPIDCMRRPMLNNSEVGDIVYDPFIGSGTTIIGAEMCGRRAFGVELHPAYIDVSLLRWQSFASADAILEATGQTFAEVRAARSKKPRLPRKARPVAVVEAEPVQPAEIL